MKKLLFSGLFAFVSLIGFSQPLTELYPQNAFLVFKKGLSDKVDTYYSIPNLKIFVNPAGVGERIEINSKLELMGFAWTQEISNNVFDFIVPVKIIPAPPVVVNPQPDYQTSGRVRLDIPGYQDVSDIFLSDASLKVKDSKRLNIQLATHSISLGENIGNKRSLVSYKITDQTGKVWTDVIQKETTVEGRLGGKYGNNHPDRQYLPYLSEDCNIYLPLSGKYTIEVLNRGDLSVDFWVNLPWSSDGQERRLHREEVPPYETRYYTIDINLLGLEVMEDFKRTIKLNFNGKLN